MRYYIFEATHSAAGENRDTWGKDTRDEAIQLYHSRVATCMAAPTVYDVLLTVVNSAGGIEVMDHWDRPAEILDTTTFNSTLTITRNGKVLQNGDKIYPGDVLTISADFNEEVETADLMVNGSEFTSGATFTVVNGCKIEAMGYLPVPEPEPEESEDPEVTEE